MNYPVGIRDGFSSARPAMPFLNYNTQERLVFSSLIAYEPELLLSMAKLSK